MHFRATNKQKRASSLKPTKFLHAAFARKYVNYLVPALQTINKSISSEEKENGELKKKVRYAVDMALVMSADGFAWSHALKDKLQTGVIIEDNLKDEMPLLQKPLVHNKSRTKPKCKLKNVKLKSSKNRMKESAKESDHQEEEEQIACRLDNLRQLLPGGNVMGADEILLTELGSYLVCLELQVNILKGLVETH